MEGQSILAANDFGVPFFCLAAPPPSISIADVAVGEAAATATVMLSLSAARPYPVNVNYSTADNVAKAITGSVTYSNSASISIPDSGIAQPYPSTISAPSVPGGGECADRYASRFHAQFGWRSQHAPGGLSGQRIMLTAG